MSYVTISKEEWEKQREAAVREMSARSKQPPYNPLPAIQRNQAWRCPGCLVWYAPDGARSCGCQRKKLGQFS